jgi:hypothetical protein
VQRLRQDAGAVVLVERDKGEDARCDGYLDLVTPAHGNHFDLDR